MSTDIWKIIRKEYETTLTSYQKLSDKHGYTKNAIATRSKKEGWIKFKKRREIIQRAAEELFAEESTSKVLDLIRKEDGSLEKIQVEIDKDVPFADIIQMVTEISGGAEETKIGLKVKMDGTIKSLAETAMMIGNKRRELRGVLPLKDRELLKLKKEELEHKKYVDYQKLTLDREALEVKKKESLGDALETEEKQKQIEENQEDFFNSLFHDGEDMFSQE
ncbi:hypothetical protein PM10SUCC1_32530 [Propionigenium maris DSM 9537]|uniref:Uncharacterized protein n=1 Tax=Propionigenium maris DSM 9537 TaxID=1123000 RepID=A0A9W6LP86_9FUSO|nr:hypothetical protein [Propionigenium maris]GLI57739.1 hypothetical protein PM10SUCC1_32530 [Propionigenium maris DSM 9537]